MCQPNVTSNDRSIADGRRSAENGRVRVNDNAVSYVGVSLNALDRIAVLIKLEALCTKGNTLIYSTIITNFSSFTNYNTHTVVNKQSSSYFCRRMDFYSCHFFRMLR